MDKHLSEIPSGWYEANCPVDYDRSPRPDGPVRQAIPIRQKLIMCAVAVFIGVIVATGGVL